ncbi:MAG: tRNA uridine-5-carboxymethylaminomethyl(34) synthesis GTPase MnmE [Lachnospiraceae bacterium]|nr:tRNA uridine-5-carboxymethylaminomethyl(34) synthesis GTPase MnmE [Lachnospiraceae bacterium]
MVTDTIAAIATAMSEAGISIVRISGENAIPAADAVFRSGKNGRRLAEAKSHTIHYGYIFDGDERIDEVLVMLMKGPNSYTGEDTVEIDCHGGVYVTKRILETVLKQQVRAADPGEFTKRAFLNGRIDLSQAEAVGDIISARNEYALKSSLDQLRGSVRETIQDLRKDLIYHIAYIESALDDPEHISLDGYREELSQVNDRLLSRLLKLIRSFDNGRMRKEGIRTVIVGKPNAGKSSLLNVLVGEDRAIVTDIAGTTRDILEEQIEIHGISLNIIDTAGIRDTSDRVEKIGVDRAISSMEKADLILYVADSSVPMNEDDEKIIEMLRGRRVIVLLNKTDLPGVISQEAIQACIDAPVICISAKEEKGIEELENTLKDLFFQGELAFNDEICITNIRHKQALQDAYESLLQVKESIALQMPEDFFSIDLMGAYESLGKVIGESVEEDLVNEIFSKFCMGK